MADLTDKQQAMCGRPVPIKPMHVDKRRGKQGQPVAHDK